MASLTVKLLDGSAKVPTVAHPGEGIGYDLYARQNVYLQSRTNAETFCLDDVKKLVFGVLAISSRKTSRQEAL